MKFTRYLDVGDERTLRYQHRGRRFQSETVAAIALKHSQSAVTLHCVAADCFSAAGKHAPRCVGNCALDAISQLIKERGGISKQCSQNHEPTQRMTQKALLRSFPRNEPPNPAKYFSERPQMNFSITRGQRRPKEEKEIRKKNDHENKIS